MTSSIGLEELKTPLIQDNLGEVPVEIAEEVRAIRECAICLQPSSGKQFVHTKNGVDLHPNDAIDEACMDQWRKQNNICPICREKNPGQDDREARCCLYLLVGGYCCIFTVAGLAFAGYLDT